MFVCLANVRLDTAKLGLRCHYITVVWSSGGATLTFPGNSFNSYDHLEKTQGLSNPESGQLRTHLGSTLRIQSPHSWIKGNERRQEM